MNYFSKFLESDILLKKFQEIYVTFTYEFRDWSILVFAKDKGPFGKLNVLVNGSSQLEISRNLCNFLREFFQEIFIVLVILLKIYF